MKKIFETKEQAIDALSNLLAQSKAQSVKLINSVVCHIEDKETSIDVTKVEVNMPNIKNTFLLTLHRRFSHCPVSRMYILK